MGNIVQLRVEYFQKQSYSYIKIIKSKAKIVLFLFPIRDPLLHNI